MTSTSACWRRNRLFRLVSSRLNHHLPLHRHVPLQSHAQAVQFSRAAYCILSLLRFSAMSLPPAMSTTMRAAVPIELLRLVEDPNDQDPEPTPEDFHWANWLQAHGLQQDEKLLKRLVHAVLEVEGRGVAGAVAKGEPRMKDVVEMLADKYKKTQEEAFVWMNSGPGQPFDLLFELRDGIRRIASGSAGEDEVARVIACRLSTPPLAVVI